MLPSLQSQVMFAVASKPSFYRSLSANPPLVPRPPLHLRRPSRMRPLLNQETSNLPLPVNRYSDKGAWRHLILLPGVELRLLPKTTNLTRRCLPHLHEFFLPLRSTSLIENLLQL
jgi:hypothetical protein